MIKLTNITKIYNKNKANEFHALKNVNLEIEDGEMIAIIGKSGAGKSTLMHIIGCIDDFDNGDYELNEINVKKLSAGKKAEIRNKHIGIVIQDFALINDYTVYENVMIPLYFGKSVKYKKDKVKNVLEKIGISDLSKKKISQLSGGQKQRVAIARALVNNPEILLADEPTGALDVNTSKEIIGLLKDLNKMGTTVIIITHDMDIANECNRVVEISDGNIVWINGVLCPKMSFW